MKVFAPAKVNLMLHVTGKRPDGYHDLQSVVVFADVGDSLTFTPASSLDVRVEGPFAHMVPRGHGNLIERAVRKFADACGRDACIGIDLAKNLPAQAGLGGGSADAAAVLKGLNLYWSAGVADDELARIGLTLGADVPVCLKGRAQWVQGVGDDLRDVHAPASMAAVLFWPGAGLPTPEMFAGLTGFSDAVPYRAAVDLGWLMQQRNDFWDGARARMPALDAAFGMMEGALLTRMSGSGSAGYGIFRHMDDAQKAAQDLRAAFAGAWVQPCYLNI